MKLTLGKTVAASMLFAGGVFLLMAGGSVYSIRQMITAADAVAHTQQVRGEINSIMEMLAGWEAANRTYIVTQREDSLEPYRDFRRQLDNRLENLRNFVDNNPVQTANWKVFKQLVEERMALIDRVVDARAQGTLTAAAVATAYREGNASMNTIRARISAMLAEEDRLLQERRETSDRQARQSILAAILTAALGLSVLGAVGWMLFRQFRAREAAEKSLAENQAVLQGIVDNAPEGIFLKDLQSRYILLNPPMRHLLGATPAECLHKTPAELFPSDRSQAILDEDAAVLKAGQPHEIELQMACADGVARTFRTVKFPLYDKHDRVYALGGISTDITERKRMEAALRQALAEAETASRTKSQFLANMSHELRTPLNSVIGFSEILSDQLFGPLNEKQQQYLKNILSSGRHLLLLINDLLDLAKIEAGRMQLDYERTPVALLVQDSTNMVRGMAERKGVSLELAPMDEELAARLDPSRAKQIIYNLASNAVKFTPQGGSVTVTAGKVAHPGCPPRGGPRGAKPGERLPGDWLLLSVADTGIGITAENLERIFIEFEQVDNSFSRQEQGTGLGLSLTRGLVTLHGGFVWAESAGRINQGSAFHVLLPLEGPPETTAQAPPMSRPKSLGAMVASFGEVAIAAANPSSNGKPLVLVVEDDLQARELLTDYLSAGGYEVAHATTGADALRLAAELQPAAITLDILLPDANGMDVLARLKATQATNKIPVIVISVTDDRQQGLSLGAVDFFIKPISSDRLLAALERARTAAKRDIEHVLVVDDEAEARDGIAAILTPRGYQVRAASSGEEALAFIERELPDVAIVDLTMPGGMSGFELVQHLRQNAATRDLPICIYTAKDLSAAEMRWLHERATAVTPKPLREQLLAELTRLGADTS